MTQTSLPIAVVYGDGAAPEMMEAALACMQAAMEHTGGASIQIIQTPMGWNAYQKTGDTTPEGSLDAAVRVGTVFFGGVGDPKFDLTIGKEKPEMMPEARALLRLRQRMGLLLNFRPMVLKPSLAHLSPLRPDLIPVDGLEMHFVRYLLEDSYFGNQDHLSLNLYPHVESGIRRCLEELGVKRKEHIDGTEKHVVNIAYFTKKNLELYLRAVFNYAKKLGLPVISVDKANVMPHYLYWRKVITRIHGAEFPDVALRHQLVDSMNALLMTPKAIGNAVIPCGNEHGDILSDGAAAIVGGLGLMHSSSINPETGAGMFESGAGTAPTLAGKDVANPLGRILTGAMLLRHKGFGEAAKHIEDAVWTVLDAGWRTRDIAEPSCPEDKILGCRGMRDQVLGIIQA